MADVYQFSQSSLQLVKSCIQAAQPDLRWLQLFKPNKEMKDNNPADDDILIPSAWESTDELANNRGQQETRQSEIELKSHEEDVNEIKAILESASSNKLDYLTEQCTNDSLLPALVESLSFETVEQICEDIFKRIDIRYKKIVLNFFPVLIKQQASCDAINLLVRGYKVYPDIIIALTECLFTSTDVPSKILEEFFNAIDGKGRLQFLQVISTIELSTEVFIHNINLIICLYENCQTTIEIHSFVLKGLLQSAQLYSDNKNYGRCLLTFFQGLNETTAQNSRQALEQLINIHKTPFKKPCQAILCKFSKRT